MDKDSADLTSDISLSALADAGVSIGKSTFIFKKIIICRF
jgi:hypothetical protein